MAVAQEQLHSTPIQPDTAAPPGSSQNRPRRLWLLLACVVVVILLVFGAILPRMRARAALRSETNELAVPSVVVVQPKPSAPGQEVVLPANVQAFKDAPIYARTNGYLKRWYVDIGARVKAGQLLAEIDAPEIDQQLLQAQADLATAEANARLAQATAERYRELIKTDSVSRQDLDNANGSLEARQT